jgi:hypothetical protein
MTDGLAAPVHGGKDGIFTYSLLVEETHKEER